MAQVAAGKLAQLKIFGNDYPTPDGTGVRDYIHVMDLAEAHVAAINRLFSNADEQHVEDGYPSRGSFEVFNIGTGKGYSVAEVISAFENSTGEKVPHVIGPRRSGDIVAIWADTTKVNNVLGWSATRNLETMMRDAWNWQLENIK